MSCAQTYLKGRSLSNKFESVVSVLGQRRLLLVVLSKHIFMIAISNPHRLKGSSENVLCTLPVVTCIKSYHLHLCLLCFVILIQNSLQIKLAHFINVKMSELG